MKDFSDLIKTFSPEKQALHTARMNQIKPEQSISQVNPVGEHANGAPPASANEEIQKIVFEWNSGPVASPEYLCLHQIFELQVQQTPDVIAIIAEVQNLQVTYNTLNEQANRLAHYLRQIGVGPEVHVGICMERTVDLVVGVLGTLKAGGSYVPMDPHYPDQRIAFLCSDAQILVLLSHTTLRQNLSRLQRTTLVYLDEIQEHLLSQRSSNLNVIPQTTNLAYVVYTSGSTGKPKGVLVQHQSLVDRTRSMIALYKLTVGHRQLQFVSPGFDVLGEELFPPLCSGATIVLSNNPTMQSTLDLLNTCTRLGVSKMNAPASYWHQIVDDITAGNINVPETLTIFVTGAESPSYAKLLQWMKQVTHPLQFFNVYGPTEATILATSYEIPCPSDFFSSQAKISIGRPLCNTQIYILDTYLRPVPIGVSGELYIGGVGIARGYLHHPDLTAEQFIPDPFHTETGARLYKTGDIARYLPDSNIEFLGRKDQQVKVRGFRIELEEIAMTLRQHPAIQEVVIQLQEEPPEKKLLVAYVTTRHGHALVAADLRRLLQSQIPGYMIPAAFVFLENFPLTPNGKVDKQALSRIDRTKQKSEREYAAPKREVESVIVAIWQDVLQREDVSIHDNFFDLGGHSLLLLRVHTLLQKNLKEEIPVIELFRQPSVGSLADYICQISVQHHKSSLPITPRPKLRTRSIEYQQQIRREHRQSHQNNS